uniref:FLYWCH-type domain-containing protein n=1 Tax=Ditylenchus dipsaci TaxID=166011 RepID=A0A915ET09_9BILA
MSMSSFFRPKSCRGRDVLVYDEGIFRFWYDVQHNTGNIQSKLQVYKCVAYPTGCMKEVHLSNQAYFRESTIDHDHDVDPVEVDKPNFRFIEAKSTAHTSRLHVLRVLSIVQTSRPQREEDRRIKSLQNEIGRFDYASIPEALSRIASASRTIAQVNREEREAESRRRTMDSAPPPPIMEYQENDE